jgi:BirA family biotin operon repressor/biotin-[acetyl-CoA-carboxylase] ligase
MVVVSFQTMFGPVETLEEIDSTNAELLRRAATGEEEGLVLAARHQTAGRGRRGRTWEAEADSSLLVSVLLRPSIAPEDLHLVTFAAGLAALEACAGEGLEGGSLKWPNDIVVEDAGRTRKLAGLLAESVLTAGRVTALVVGMGLNLNWPSDVPAGGVALNQLLHRHVVADRLLGRWLGAFESRYRDSATPAGRERVRSEYRAACSTIGSLVRVETPGGVIEGRAVDVSESGHLVVVGDERWVLSVGDVHHVRGVSGR